MPDSSGTGGSSNGDSDSKRGLWTAIRNFFDDEGDTSLRAQIEEAIAEHEDEQAASAEPSDDGDLSPFEVTLLRNLLHFSDHDADDVAIPRGEIVAVAADASWDELVAQFAEHGHSRMPVYRDTLDHVIGMMHIKDVFPFLATGKPPPADWTTLMRQPLYVPQARGAPLVTVAAQSGVGLDRLMKAVGEAHRDWTARVKTKDLNEWLHATIARHPPPAVRGKRIKPRYLTQIKARPPTFVLIASRAEEMPESYKRYLVNGLREAFDLHAAPVRLIVKAGKNPFVDEA